MFGKLLIGDENVGIATIPPEIFEKIVTQLPYKSDIANLSMTNKKMRQQVSRTVYGADVQELNVLRKTAHLRFLLSGDDRFILSYNMGEIFGAVITGFFIMQVWRDTSFIENSVGSVLGGYLGGVPGAILGLAFGGTFAVAYLVAIFMAIGMLIMMFAAAVLGGPQGAAQGTVFAGVFVSVVVSILAVFGALARSVFGIIGTLGVVFSGTIGAAVAGYALHGSEGAKQGVFTYANKREIISLIKALTGDELHSRSGKNFCFFKTGNEDLRQYIVEKQNKLSKPMTQSGI